MSWLIDKIRERFAPPAPAPPNLDRLRSEFRARYHSFKLLLGANQKALEIMASIEQALEGHRPFGMSFVRSHCTSMAVNVYSMIQHLRRLAPGKHAGLEDRFDHIRQQIEQVLRHDNPIQDQRLIIPLDAVDRDNADFVGNKMANLGALIRNSGLKTPAGFAFTAYAYHRFLDHNRLQAEIDRRIQAADLAHMEGLYPLSSEIQQLIIRSEIPQDVSAALTEAWQGLEAQHGQPITVALRSSATGEDAAGSSFAGQYRSELNVSRENVFHAYKEILASKYSPQAIVYRLNKGFRDEDIAMCVGCMVMVDALAGGVIYSRSPVDAGDHSLFINAALGLPKSVVDGSGACDLFVVSRDTPPKIVYEEIQVKTQKFVCYPEEGVCRMDLTGDAASRPAINQDTVLRLARVALKIERFYGVPQDIEWAIEADGRIFILQCRPLIQAEQSPRSAARQAPKTASETVLLQGGITASAGVASGKVYLVDKEFDILGFPQGAVMVARQALPRWASLLNRAAAVVTEQGGFAGHLANVAREFKVPALFGLKDAVARLTSGELVTVDATGRAVHRGEVMSHMDQADVPPNLMADSPIYRTLVDVSRHMIPLNLLDPDAADFKPESCRTLHDITRYIHEKSVQAMFTFGREHHFTERSSKQLHYHVPMKWWILNLDDGFTEEVRGKYVRLSEIASLPMLSFWEGYTAIEWEGPPVDGKGLMSVMFQSTANTALSPTVRSRFADRNYFIISKHYCHLSSRLGYHFSLLEALVGERERENYVSFQFKGGATDDQRRFKRVQFIGDILVDYGFSAQIREDTLKARVEGHAKDYMLERIKILGYLSLHTRQLDMIMSNTAKVNYYRTKIRSDIEAIIAQGPVGAQ